MKKHAGMKGDLRTYLSRVVLSLRIGSTIVVFCDYDGAGNICYFDVFGENFHVKKRFKAIMQTLNLMGYSQVRAFTKREDLQRYLTMVGFEKDRLEYFYETEKAWTKSRQHSEQVAQA